MSNQVPTTAGVPDANAHARRTRLARLQGQVCLVIHTQGIRTAFRILVLLLILGILGRVEYEDALSIQAERDAFTRALSRCANDHEMVAANSSANGDTQ